MSTMEALTIEALAASIVARYLTEEGYTSTLEAYQQEARRLTGSTLSEDRISSSPDLRTLVELYDSTLRQDRERRATTLSIVQQQRIDLKDLQLLGPSTLPYSLFKTHSNLHPSNILSLSQIILPTRRFSTECASYVMESRRLLCSTGADKTIVMSDSESGEMVEVLEPASGTEEFEIKHSAAILCTAQNPTEHRELISSGMDSKVIVWDLFHKRPVQTIKDHSRFVVRCAYSPSGRYIATCSYDKTIRLYERGSLPRTLDSHHDEEVETEPLSPNFKAVHTIKTTENPEAILFFKGPRYPSSVSEEASKARSRTWLAYTTRNDCFIHYVALPLNEVQASELQSMVETKNVEQVTNQVENVTLDTPGKVKDFEAFSFNTNLNPEDFHVSYSLLYLTLHPLGAHIAIQTGDHSIPSSGYAAASSSISRILLVPLLSQVRTATLWTGAASTGFATNRHAWLKDGTGAWTTSDEGILRLVDMSGKIRASVPTHGAAAEIHYRARIGMLGVEESEEMRRTASWGRGGNTVIKDVIVLDNGDVASVGFDRTIRLLRLQE